MTSPHARRHHHPLGVKEKDQSCHHEVWVYLSHVDLGWMTVGHETLDLNDYTSAPPAMKTKVGALPDDIILTVGAKTLPLRGSVAPAEDQRASRRKQDHHCGRQNASAARKCCSCRRPTSFQTETRSPLWAPKRFRCAEVLLLPKTNELPDGNKITTAGAKTLPLHGSVAPAEDQRASRRRQENASAARKCCSCRRPTSFQTETRSPLWAPKRFRCAEVLLLPKTNELPDGNKITTVGAKTLPLRGSVAPAEDQRASRRKQDHHCGRQNAPAEVLLLPKTNELPDGNKITTVGAKTLPLRGSVAPAEDQRASRRKQDHHCGRQNASAARKCCSCRRPTSFQTETRSPLWAPKRSRCAEVLLLPKTNELPDGNKITIVGAKTLPLRGSVAPAEDQRASRRKQDHHCGRQNASAARKCCSCRRPTSFQTETRSPLWAPKRFRCAEVLLLPKTNELPDGNKITTVGAKTLPLRGSVAPAGDQRASRRKQDHHCGRQKKTLPLRGSVAPAEDQRASRRRQENASAARKCCSCRRPTSFQTETRSPLWAPKRFRCAEVLFLPKTNELPDGNKITTVGAKTLPLHGSVAPAEDQRASRRKQDHHCGRQKKTLSLRGSVAPAEDQRASRRKQDHHCGRQKKTLSLRGSVAPAEDQRASRRKQDHHCGRQKKTLSLHGSVAPAEDQRASRRRQENASAARKCCSCRRPTSFQTETRSPLCAPKRFRCAEVLLLPKTNEHPDGNKITTVGATKKTLSLRGSVVPAEDQRASRRKQDHHCGRQKKTLSLRGSVVPAEDQRASRRKQDHHCGRHNASAARKCCSCRRPTSFQTETRSPLWAPKKKRFRCAEVLFLPKTNELPDGNKITTVRAKTLPLRGSVALAEDQRASRRKQDHHCGRQKKNASAARKCCSCRRPTSFQTETRSPLWAPKKTLSLRGSVVPAEDHRASRRKQDHHCGRQNASAARKCCSCRRPTSFQTETRSPLWAPKKNAARKRCSCRRPTSFQAETRSPLWAPKRFRCAEVLLLPKTTKLPDANKITTVGAKTLPLRGSVALAEDQRASRRKQDHHCGRQNASAARKCCSCRRPTSFQTETRSPLCAPKRFRCAEVLFLPKTNELPDGNKITTVGAKTLPLRGSVAPAEDQRASRRKQDHHCARQNASAAPEVTFYGSRTSHGEVEPLVPRRARRYVRHHEIVLKDASLGRTRLEEHGESRSAPRWKATVWVSVGMTGSSKCFARPCCRGLSRYRHRNRSAGA